MGLASCANVAFWLIGLFAIAAALFNWGWAFGRSWTETEAKRRNARLAYAAFGGGIILHNVLWLSGLLG